MASQKTVRTIRIVGAIAVLGGSAALWKLSGLGSGEELAREARPFLYSASAPLLILAVYVVGAGLAFFPILPLIIATGLLFRPMTALAYSLGGSVAAALIGYLLGRRLPENTIRVLAGKRFASLCDTLRAAGFSGVAAVRLFPAAPYTVVGLVAGAMRVRFWAYMAGTLVGLAPGVLIFSLLGSQLRSGGKLWLTGLTLAAAFALGLAGWLRARHKQRRAAAAA